MKKSFKKLNKTRFKNSPKLNIHGIRAKIISILLFVSLFSICVIGVSSYLRSKGLLYEKLKTTSKQINQEVDRGINNYFSLMSNMILILSRDNNIIQADNSGQFELAKPLITNMKESDKNITSICIQTENGMFYTYPEKALSQYDDPKTSIWYTTAMDNPEEVIITEPYSIASTDVVTIAKAIYQDSKIIGVVGMNINLTYYSYLLSQIKIGDDGYAMIVDSNGSIISHPNLDLLGKSCSEDFSFWTEVGANQEGFISYQYLGDDYFSSYMTNDLTGWKIMAILSNSELLKDTQAIKNTLIVFLLLMTVCSILIAIFFSKPIDKNIKTLLTAFDKVAKGDVTVKVAIRSKDEFHELGKQFNEMTDNISALIQNVSNSSMTVLETSVELASMAEETNSSIGEVAKAIEDVANGVTDQAQTSADGAANVKDLALRINMVEDATNFIQDLSSNANILTNKGLSSVESLLQKSSNTKLSTNKVAELIYSMSKSMNQINEISDTIDSITAQTNLLSLNASIEAARAGQAGKGFAVVADEIRKLADQSQESTLQIKEIVEDITAKTKLTVAAMEQTDTNVKEQETVVDQTQTVFNDIMAAVNNLTIKVSEIKDNITDISKMEESIVSQIESISSISEQSASATQQVTASTSQIAITMDNIANQASALHRLSEDLQSSVSNFKLD